MEEESFATKESESLSNESNLTSGNKKRHVSENCAQKLSTYILAIRPWSFSCSLIPVLLGFTLAGQTGASCSYITFVISAFTALAVHAAANVVNTYYDFLKGIDSKESSDRTLVDKILLTDEISFLGIILYCIGCVGFVILIIISPVKLGHLTIIYFGGLSGSFLYTGGIGLKYIALGDLLILIIFGPVTVLFSYVVQTGTVNFGTIYYAIPLALTAEAILHSNNTRDLESDRKAGIVTLAIIIGHAASEVLYSIILLAPFTMFIVWGVKYSSWFLLPIVALPEAFKTERHFRTVSKKDVPQRTARLNIVIGFLYTLAVKLSEPGTLPFING